MITIVDSGGANIASILFALEGLGVRAMVSCEARAIQSASHVILPGVGSADKVMQRLQALKLDRVVRELVQPVLGICVGMQVLFTSSEEGETAVCMNRFSGEVKSLEMELGTHMGWNTLEITKPIPLLKDVPNQAYVYFVHRFAAPVLDCTCAVTHYGASFSALVAQQNFFGTQFHPERSGAVGRQILKNFLEL